MSETVQAFTELQDGWFLVTLRDGRSFKIKTAASKCPYCESETTTHQCSPIRREVHAEA